MSTRAVRLLKKLDSGDESEPRDEWWKDVREEIQSHARSLGVLGRYSYPNASFAQSDSLSHAPSGCNAVVGYYEATSIHDSICLLCATGILTCATKGTTCLNLMTSPFICAGTAVVVNVTDRSSVGGSVEHSNSDSGTYISDAAGSPSRPTNPDTLSTATLTIPVCCQFATRIVLTAIYN